MNSVLTMRKSNRTFGSELVMPENYISLDCDEMEYVEGGAYSKWFWWGYRTYYTNSDVKAMESITSVASVAVGVVPGIFLVAYSEWLDHINNGYGIYMDSTWLNIAGGSVGYVAMVLTAKPLSSKFW